MAKAFVFYNPMAGEGKILEDLDVLEFVLPDDSVFWDMTKWETYEQALFSMQPEDYLVVCGGDGTLHRFVNLTCDLDRSNGIALYPAGEHNDFARDFGRVYGCNPFSVTAQLRQLPRMETDHRSCRFLTGIVFEAGGRIRRISGKKRGYTEKNTPCPIRTVVDGKEGEYDRVRFAALMYGRHCCGGMAPDPARQQGDGELSLVMVHGCGKRESKWLLGRLRKGRPVHSRYVTVLRGRSICLAFDRPVQLRADGEPYTDIMRLSVTLEI